MRRREKPVSTDDVMPEWLRVFDAADWPTPPPCWTLGARGYARMHWQRARQAWRRAQRREFR